MKMGWRLLFLSLAACEGQTNLSGSMSEIFPLENSSVQVLQNGEAMQIVYLLNRGVFLDVVARISVSLNDEGAGPDGGIPQLELKAGSRVELQGQAPGGVARCAVTHAPGGEPVRDLPPVKQGDLRITRGGQIGQLTEGNFSIRFEQEGGDIGFGRTLNGTFSATTQDAGFGALP
jgi:hypothetical protein